MERAPTVIAVDRDLRTLFLALVQSTYSIIRPSADIARQVLALLEERPGPASALPMPTTASALVVAEALRFNPGDERGVDELAGSAHTSGVLLRSRTTLDAVARRVGYASTSAFRRVFTGHFGMTPGQYVERFGVEP